MTRFEKYDLAIMEQSKLLNFFAPAVKKKKGNNDQGLLKSLLAYYIWSLTESTWLDTCELIPLSVRSHRFS